MNWKELIIKKPFTVVAILWFLYWIEEAYSDIGTYSEPHLYGWDLMAAVITFFGSSLFIGFLSGKEWRKS